MKLTRHLFLKDLRAARPWWLVILVLAAGLALMPPRGDAWTDRSWNSLSFWLGCLLCLAVGLLQQRLLHLDPPEGAERFIGTRPVSGWQVISGKACVLLLFGLLPLLAALTLRLFRLGLMEGWQRVPGILGQDLCLLALTLGLAGLPHALPGRSGWAVLAGVLGALVIFIFGSGLLSLPLPAGALNWFMAFAVISCACAGAMLMRYGRLSGWRGAAGIGLVVLLGGGLSAFSFGLYKSMDARPAGTGVDLRLQPDRVRQMIETSKQAAATLALKLQRLNSPVEALMQGNRDIQFRQHVRLQGLPENVYADFESSTGSFRVAGQGEWQELHRASTWSWEVIPDAAFHAVPGNPPPAAEAVALGQSFDIPLGRAESPGLQKGHEVQVSLKGEARFLLYRARLEKVLPIEEGGVWSTEGLRLAFSRVSRSAGQVQFQVEVDLLDMGTQGELRSLSMGKFDHGFFGLHPSGGLPARLNSFRGWEERHPLLRHERFVEQIQFSIQDSWWRFPEVQKPAVPLTSEKAELGIFRREIIGTVSVPYEFEDAEIGW